MLGRYTTGPWIECRNATAPRAIKGAIAGTRAASPRILDGTGGAERVRWPRASAADEPADAAAVARAAPGRRNWARRPRRNRGGGSAPAGAPEGELPTAAPGAHGLPSSIMGGHASVNLPPLGARAIQRPGQRRRNRGGPRSEAERIARGPRVIYDFRYVRADLQWIALTSAAAVGDGAARLARAARLKSSGYAASAVGSSTSTKVSVPAAASSPSTVARAEALPTPRRSRSSDTSSRS